MSEETTSEDETGSDKGGRRWLLVSVIVPIVVALIGALTVVVQQWTSSDKDCTDEFPGHN